MPRPTPFPLFHARGWTVDTMAPPDHGRPVGGAAHPARWPIARSSAVTKPSLSRTHSRGCQGAAAEFFFCGGSHPPSHAHTDPLVMRVMHWIYTGSTTPAQWRAAHLSSSCFYTQRSVLSSLDDIPTVGVDPGVGPRTADTAHHSAQKTLYIHERVTSPGGAHPPHRGPSRAASAVCT